MLALGYVSMSLGIAGQARIRVSVGLFVHVVVSVCLGRMLC